MGVRDQGQLRLLAAEFQRWDKDHDGRISLQDLTERMQRLTHIAGGDALRAV